MTKLVFDNVWEAIFENDPERAKDYEILGQLAIKYRDELQLHFGTEESYKEMERVYLEFKYGDQLVTD